MAQPVVPVEAELTFLRHHLSEFKRRASVRYRCNLATLVRLFFPLTNESVDGWVHNLSSTGIGLNLPRPLEVGTTLIIRLKGPSLTACIHVPATVAHSTPEVDGSYRVGCALEKNLSGRLRAGKESQRRRIGRTAVGF
jgi:hypothetical protein